MRVEEQRGALDPVDRDFIVGDASGGPPLPALWAWVAIDPDGSEGIVAAPTVDDRVFPLVTGDRVTACTRYEDIIDQIRPSAPDCTFELRRYSADLDPE